MSILIKGMEMPDSCFHCKLAEVCQHYKAEHYANKRHEDCPLEEVPETHEERTETHACDLIDRQAVLKAINNMVKECDSVYVTSALRNLEVIVADLPSAQPDVPDTNVEDTISRQAVYNVLDKMPVRGFKKDGETIHGLISLSQVNSAIINLPSAQPEPSMEECACCVLSNPERKKGTWIEHNPRKWGLGIVFECSECGEKIDCEPSNFCPNCGAEMEGQE